MVHVSVFICIGWNADKVKYNDLYFDIAFKKLRYLSKGHWMCGLRDLGLGDHIRSAVEVMG